MAHRLVSDEVFLTVSLDLFRTYGFEGVSLKQLADNTGLEKASIYYRYPGGKDEIVMAVAIETAAWYQSNVFKPLLEPGLPHARISLVAERLREFHVGGSKGSLMEILSIRGGPAELQTSLKETMRSWISVFAQIASESGFTTAAAHLRAEEAIGRIEGSLVLGRVVGDTASFERILKLLPSMLTTV
jgi:AcrR family transcriptional regulator